MIMFGVLALATYGRFLCFTPKFWVLSVAARVKRRMRLLCERLCSTYSKGNAKNKFSLHGMNAYGESGGIAPPIFNLGAGWW